MLETLIGGVLGGVTRLFPEVLNYYNKKEDRKHELAMFDKQLESDKLKAESALAQTKAQGEVQLDIKDIEAIVEATKAQAIKSGIAWVDALSSLMRPLITFWWVIVLYSAALSAKLWLMYQHYQDFASAIIAVWGADEKAIVASIVSFWFCDRSLRKMRR